MSRSVVSVIRSSPATVFADIAEACAQAGMAEALPPGATVILKDNISWHFPYLSANTTPWQLEGTVRALKALGRDDLVTVHNNTVVTDPYKGGRLNKLTPIYEKHGIEERFNFDRKDIRWVPYAPKTPTLALHKIYPGGIHIPEYFVGKSILHLPTVKTHIYTTTTGAIKNAFGGLLNTRRHYTHSWIHETLVDLLAIQKEIHAGIFCVMDGTICGSGPGPRTMQPVEKGLFLASADSVAIDAVAAKLMGFDPLAIPYIRLAHERGLGVGDPSGIDIRGVDVSGMNFGFRVGDNTASKVGHLLWFSPLKRIQWLCFHTPRVYLFVFGSYFYHDFLWWPVKGRKIQRRLRKDSAWARFFDSYPDPPAPPPAP
ncbi:MAG: DUF362 domain-containing protein [Acidobacteria bacterium]|nr:DUF362 domain-containing protein [Acidobacteriota bacterium]